MFWSQLLLWLSGRPFIFFGIFGIIFGVNVLSDAEFGHGAGSVFITMGATLTLVGSALWSYASWRFYRDNKK